MPKKRSKKIRYIQQRNDFSCGPVSIVNALKWLGYPLTSRHVKIFEALMDTKRGRGTPNNNITETLKLFKVKYAYYPFIDIYDIDNALKKNKFLLVVHSWYDRSQKRNFAHAMVIESKTKKRYKTANAAGKAKRTIQYWSRKKLKSEIGWAQAWIIER